MSEYSANSEQGGKKPKYEQTETQVKCPHCNFWIDKDSFENSWRHSNAAFSPAVISHYYVCGRCAFKIHADELEEKK